MLDGQVDYSHLSREELANVLRAIDGERYPINHANALARYRALEVPVSAAAAKPESPKRRDQLVAEALQLHVSAIVLMKYAMLYIVAVGLASIVAGESVAIRALTLGQTSDPISRGSNPYFIATGLIAALLVYVLLAKRHPRGYFVTAFCVCLVAGAVDIALTIAIRPSAADYLLQRFFPSLVWNSGLITLAGFLCGLMRLPGAQSQPDEADPVERG